MHGSALLPIFIYAVSACNVGETNITVYVDTNIGAPPHFSQDVGWALYMTSTAQGFVPICSLPPHANNTLGFGVNASGPRSFGDNASGIATIQLQPASINSRTCRCIPEGSYVFVAIDNYGDGWTGERYKLVNDASGETLLESIEPRGFNNGSIADASDHSCDSVHSSLQTDGCTSTEDSGCTYSCADLVVSPPICLAGNATTFDQCDLNGYVCVDEACAGLGRGGDYNACVGATKWVGGYGVDASTGTCVENVACVDGTPSDPHPAHVKFIGFQHNVSTNVGTFRFNINSSYLGGRAVRMGLQNSDCSAWFERVGGSGAYVLTFPRFVEYVGSAGCVSLDVGKAYALQLSETRAGERCYKNASDLDKSTLSLFYERPSWEFTVTFDDVGNEAQVIGIHSYVSFTGGSSIHVGLGLGGDVIASARVLSGATIGTANSVDEFACNTTWAFEVNESNCMYLNGTGRSLVVATITSTDFAWRGSVAFAVGENSCAATATFSEGVYCITMQCQIYGTATFVVEFDTSTTSRRLDEGATTSTSRWSEPYAVLITSAHRRDPPHRRQDHTTINVNSSAIGVLFAVGIVGVAAKRGCCGRRIVRLNSHTPRRTHAIAWRRTPSIHWFGNENKNAP